VARLKDFSSRQGVIRNDKGAFYSQPVGENGDKMNRKFLLAACGAILVLLGMPAQQTDAVANGQAVFDSLRCSSCHKPDTDKVGASLQRIAEVYGDHEKLLAYLKGNSEPIIAPERRGVMKGQLKKVAKLTDEEKQALADYILTFK